MTTESKVFWQCDHCKVRAIEESGQVVIDDSQIDRSQNYWHYLNSYEVSETKEAPFEIDGYAYCDNCATYCDDCEAIVLVNGAEYGLDTYDSGNSFIRPGQDYSSNPDYLCIDCYEKAHSEYELETVKEELKSFLDKIDEEEYSTEQAFVEYAVSYFDNENEVLSKETIEDLAKKYFQEYYS